MNEPMTAMSVVSDAHSSQVSLRVNRSIAFRTAIVEAILPAKTASIMER
jgi:hypothetical protein